MSLRFKLRRPSRIFGRRFFALLVGVGTVVLSGQATPPLVQMAAGDIPYSVLGPLPAAPVPTVFIFALDRVATLQRPSFNRSGMQLRESEGFLCVSLDLPAHGEDIRPGEPAGLPGWRARLDRQEDIAEWFARRTTRVLDHLVAEGYADPSRVGVIGISRGGFMALHWMAREPRVRAAALVAPSTDLAAVEAIVTPRNQALAGSLALERSAAHPNFQKPIWIIVGNNDAKSDRTEYCIRFARAVAAAAPAGTEIRPVELHIVAGEGHRQPPGTHEQIAAWLARTLAPAP